MHGPFRGVRVNLDANGRYVIASTATGEAGRYELDAPEGTVHVKMSASGGYRPKDRVGATVGVEPPLVTEVTDLSAASLPKIRGTVLLPDGKPAAGALVGDDYFGSNRSTLTDASGRFELQLINEFGTILNACHLTERLSAGLGVPIEGGQAPADVVLRLAPESDVQGTLVGSDGKPKAGEKVHLAVKMSCGRSTLFRDQEIGRTDDAGRYRFRGLNRSWSYRASAYGMSENKPGTGSPWIDPREKAITLKPITLSTPPEDFDPEPRSAAEWHCQEWINSDPLRLEALRGKVVLLNFWATWCGPCVAELPQLQRLHELYADKGLVVLGLHHNSVPAERVKAFVRDHKLTFPVALDDARGGTCGAYNITAFPKGILIGRDGKVLRTGLHGDLLGIVRRAVLYDDKGE
jgi:thiol-disulfide isomerase/thioredoxin